LRDHAGELLEALKISDLAIRSARLAEINEKYGTKPAPRPTVRASLPAPSPMNEAEYAKKWRTLKSSPGWLYKQKDFRAIEREYRLSNCTPETAKTMAEYFRLEVTLATWRVWRT